MHAAVHGGPLVQLGGGDPGAPGWTATGQIIAHAIMGSVVEWLYPLLLVCSAFVGFTHAVKMPLLQVPACPCAAADKPVVRGHKLTDPMLVIPVSCRSNEVVV
jgi:hypothetical protein